MKAKKNKSILESFVIENQFLDVMIPKIDNIPIELTTKVNRYKNSITEEIEKEDYDYTVSFSMNFFHPIENKEFSKKIQEITKMPFPPYKFYEKKYLFYTSKWTGDLENKKEILKNLFQYLTAYEKEFIASNQKYQETIKNDITNSVSLETIHYTLQYNKELKSYILLLKTFIGTDKYVQFKQSSNHIGKIADFSSVEYQKEVHTPFDIDYSFFGKKEYLNKSYFVINPLYYLDVKNIILLDKEKENNFFEMQKKESEKQDLSKFDIEENNLFQLKIKFIPEKNWFEFYCKGYDEPSFYNGYKTNRKLLSLFAINFLLSEPYDSNIHENFYSDSDIVSDSKQKIQLTFIDGSDKRHKKMLVPATDWQQIEKIYHNYYEIQKLFGRPVKSIKITNTFFNFSDNRYPSIYFSNKGENFLIISSRLQGYSNFQNIADQVKKSKSQQKPVATLKGFSISKEEVDHFLNHHIFSEYIRQNTKEINIQTIAEKSNLSREEKEKIWTSIWLNYELNQSTNNHKKRLKI